MVKQPPSSAFVGASLAEQDVARRFREHYTPAIQGIEKVYIPFFEFEFLATFDDGRTPSAGTYWCDTVMATCRLLPADFAEPRLMARRGGTVLPVERTVDEARDTVRRTVIAGLPSDVARKGLTFNLTLEYRGTFFVPFWVAYFQGARPGMFDFIVFDSQTGNPDVAAKDIVDRGFLILDERKDTLPPWF